MLVFLLCSWHYSRFTCRVKVCDGDTDQGQDFHCVRVVGMRAVPQIHYHDITGRDGM